MLIALFDPDHLFHDKAHEWWSQHRNLGWASCTLTENGLIRILSNPKYSPDRPFTPVEILGRLQEYIHQSDHVLLLESPSLLDETLYQLQPQCRSAEMLICLYKKEARIRLQSRITEGRRPFDRNGLSFAPCEIKSSILRKRINLQKSMLLPVGARTLASEFSKAARKVERILKPTVAGNVGNGFGTLH